jgi:hypothetical protein
MKSALIPGFTAYDVTPVTDNHVTVPPAVAPNLAPAPIPQRFTRSTALGLLSFQMLAVLRPAKRVTMMMDLQSLLQQLMLLLI